jgi:hypothetical protein
MLPLLRRASSSTGIVKEGGCRFVIGENLQRRLGAIQIRRNSSASKRNKRIER